MFNGVLLVAIIATWILKVTSLPKLYYIISLFRNKCTARFVNDYEVLLLFNEGVFFISTHFALISLYRMLTKL